MKAFEADVLAAEDSLQAAIDECGKYVGGDREASAFRVLTPLLQDYKNKGQIAARADMLIKANSDDEAAATAASKAAYRTG